MNLAWCDTAENLRHAEELIKSQPGADVYVLPEMFTTGFCMEPSRIAEPMEGPTLAWMRRVASDTDAAIVGSVATIAPEGGYKNRMYFVEPDGQVFHYDKRHLFSYSGEDKHYEAGKERVIVEFRSVRFFLQVCYDLRFPVFGRNCDDYDVALYVANWPDKRRMAWDILLRARAIENQCFVAAVNRVGVDQYGIYSGDSVIINPYGENVVAAQEGKVEMVSAELDIEKMIHFREKFPVLDDADTELFM